MAERERAPERPPTDSSTADSFLRNVARAPSVFPLPQEGQLIGGKYRIERRIGAGAMGAVFAARHELLQQKVALKVMLPEHAASPSAAARFLNEARNAARIEGEHVARVLDLGHLENESPFIALELLEGADLAHVLEQRGSLPMAEAVDYLLQALEAISQAHALGIVHRDLKPANLFLAQRRDGSQLVKVLDFGISKALNREPEASAGVLTKSSSMLGSPRYMSPEQVRESREVDARTDVWACGVVLFELLTGEAPFDGTTVNQVLAQVLQDEAKLLRNLRPDLPEELEQVIARCLHKEPAQRFQNVADLASSLATFAPTRARPLLDRIAQIPVTTWRAKDESLVSPFAPTLVDDIAPTLAVATPAVARSSTHLSKRAWSIALPFGLVLIVGIMLALARRESPEREARSETSATARLPAAPVASAPPALSQPADAPAAVSRAPTPATASANVSAKSSSIPPKKSKPSVAPELGSSDAFQHQK